MIWVVLLLWLNYFPLHRVAKESAKRLPDQLAFKIHSEIVEAIHDAMAIIYPPWDQLAEEGGLSKNMRLHRHSKAGSVGHPMIAWIAHSYANYERMMSYAVAYKDEHIYRTGKEDLAVIPHIDFISANVTVKHFSGDTFEAGLRSICGYLASEEGSEGMKKSRRELNEKRKVFCEEYQIGFDAKGNLRPQTKISPLPRFFGDAKEPLAKIDDVYKAYIQYLNRFKSYSLRFLNNRGPPKNVYDAHRVQSERASASKRVPTSPASPRKRRKKG